MYVSIFHPVIAPVIGPPEVRAETLLPPMPAGGEQGGVSGGPPPTGDPAYPAPTVIAETMAGHDASQVMEAG